MTTEIDLVNVSTAIITYSIPKPRKLRACSILFEGDRLSLEDELLAQRLQRVDEIQALGYPPYGSRFEFTHQIPEILTQYGSKTADELTPLVDVKICGRLETVRRMGKAGFAHLSQGESGCKSMFARTRSARRIFSSTNSSISATSWEPKVPVPHQNRRAVGARHAPALPG